MAKDKKITFAIEGNATGVADAADIDLSEDKVLVEKAAKWVVDFTGDSHTDPFDGGVYGMPEDGPEALVDHLINHHSLRCVAWFLNPDLGANALSLAAQRKEGEDIEREVAPLELPVQALEDNTNPRYTRVPDSVRKKLQAAGDYGRWVRQEDVRHYNNMGYYVVDRPKDETPTHQHNTADTALRSREMVYVAQRGEDRRKVLDMREKMRAESNAQLPARQENTHRIMSDVGKETYDSHVRNGMPSHNALVLARRAERENRVIK